MFHNESLEISDSQRDQFRSTGALVLRGAVSDEFVGRFRETVSQWSERLVRAVGLRPRSVSCAQDAFDANLVVLRSQAPAEAGNLYDAIKKMRALMQWASSRELIDLAGKLLGSADIGVASRGWGVRIDYPGDISHRTQLHQEFVSQLCGPQGVVLWTPLRDVTRELGPVIYYPGSHSMGLLPLEVHGAASQDQRIRNCGGLRASLAFEQPEIAAGDLLILDFLTLHESGLNVGQVPRWSLTTRLFNAGDEASIEMRWRGGIQEGNTLKDLPPTVKAMLNLDVMEVKSIQESAH